jgi:hypothetical protein
MMMKTYIKSLLKWGLITAVIVIVYSATMDALDLKTGLLAQIIGYISIVILPMGIYLGMKETQTLSGKRISFFKGLLIGISISILAAAVIVLYRYVTINYLSDVIDVYTMEDRFRDQLNSMDLSEEQISIKMEEFKKMYSPYETYLNTIKWYLILGTLYSTVIFFILKIKKRKNHEKNYNAPGATGTH